MRLSAFTSLLWMVVLAGCVHPVVLRPAASAALVPNQNDAATAEASGVRISVFGTWNGDPPDLWRVVTPVRVTIENHSGVPIAIHYKSFALVTSTGFREHAVPPFQVQRPGVIRPYYPFGGFYVPPPFGGLYPGYPAWDQPFDYDPAYFDTYYQWQQALPSSDMLAKALPVGVLDNNGTLTGYVFFQKLAKGIESVTFTAEFSNAQNAAAVASVSIPLVVANNK